MGSFAVAVEVADFVVAAVAVTVIAAATAADFATATDFADEAKKKQRIVKI